MEIINGSGRLPEKGKPLFLALGNFDGVHRGHQAIINELVKRSQHHSGFSAALIFNPHPVIALGKDKPVALLTAIADRAAIMAELGLDYLIVEPFNKFISSLTPEQFVRQILIEKYAVRGVFIGENYKFGRQGAGSADTLRYWGKELNFSVDVSPLLSFKGKEVSSSLIRTLLLSGAVREAADYLNYYFFRQGRVVRGYGVGKKLVYPTANITTNQNLLWPGKGVYLTAVGNLGKQPKFGVTNVGSRPTFAHFDVTVETHIIDFNKTLYNREIRLCFLEKMRETKAFSDPAQLKKQIGRDIEQAKILIPNFSQVNKGNVFSLQAGCTMLRSQ